MSKVAGSVFLAVIALCLTATTAEARGRKFSCPMPDKRACLSAEQVYNATHNGAKLDATGKQAPEFLIPQQPVIRPIEPVAGTPVQVPDRCCEPTRTAVTIKGDTLAVASPVVAPVHGANVASASGRDMVIRTAREEPFRTPAQVMRIYIASWEDESGDLHMGGYLFSEIEPRKWSVGIRQRETSDSYRLLTLSQPSRDAAQEANSGNGDATANASRAE